MRVMLAFVVFLLSPTVALAAERLVLSPYPATPPWKEVTNRVAGLQFLREQIPADQNINAYRDILTAQSFPQQRGADPSAYLRAVFGGVSNACDSVRVNGPTARLEQGVPVAYAQIYCGRQKGQAFGVTMLFKAISGADALYVVQREFRVPPSSTAGVASGPQAVATLKAQAVADAYLLNKVYLCAARSADPRCVAKR